MRRVAGIAIFTRNVYGKVNRFDVLLLDIGHQGHIYTLAQNILTRRAETHGIDIVIQANQGINLGIAKTTGAVVIQLQKIVRIGVVIAQFGGGRIGFETNITQNSFENMVGDAENFISVLGSRDYVQPYRDGFKWNPADERLKFAWVSIVTEDCEPYFEGKIFAWDCY